MNREIKSLNQHFLRVNKKTGTLKQNARIPVGLVLMYG
jgi:hypothetical protein